MAQCKVWPIQGIIGFFHWKTCNLQTFATSGFLLWSGIFFYIPLPVGFFFSAFFSGEIPESLESPDSHKRPCYKDLSMKINATIGGAHCIWSSSIWSVPHSRSSDITSGEIIAVWQFLEPDRPLIWTLWSTLLIASPWKSYKRPLGLF